MTKSRMVIPLLVGFILLVVVCCVFADEGGTFRTFAREGGNPYVAAPLPLDVQLSPVFEKAAKKYHVPVELLLALGYYGSNFENRGAAPTIEGGYGIMALRDNILGGDSLLVGSSLIGVPVEVVKVSPKANIYAAAAVLDNYAKEMKIKRNEGLDAWLDPVIKYAGLDKVHSRMFAMEVFQKLQSGLLITNSGGETFTFAPQDIGSVDLEGLEPPGSGGKDGRGDIGILTTDQYDPAVWYPAASCNYAVEAQSKDTIVIHTCEGTAAGCLAWFQNCDAEASAHYVVSEAGGVWQCVDEWYRAWHAGCYSVNSRSIGIEHEGYAGSPSHPQSLYNASGLLSRDICDSWGVPKVHTSAPPGIIGHDDANACCCFGDHWDPGPGWDWNYYISVVNSVDNPPTLTGTAGQRMKGDFNGDGREDIVVAYNYGNANTALWMFLSTGSGFAAPAQWWNSGIGNWEAERSQWVAGDFNYDGKSDVAAMYDYGSASVTLFVFRSTGSAFSGSEVWWSSGSGNWEAGRTKLVAGDFNGGGVCDIAAAYDYGSANTALFVFMSSKTSFLSPVLWWNSGAGNWEASRSTWVSGNFNGDSKYDIACAYDYGYANVALWTFISRGKRFKAPAQWWNSGAGNWEASRSTWIAGDVNADGKRDIVCAYDYGYANVALYTFISRGKRFKAPAQWWNSDTGNWEAPGSRWVMADLTGDGKCDVSAFYNYGSNTSALWEFTSTGSGFAAPAQWWSSCTGCWVWERSTAF